MTHALEASLAEVRECPSNTMCQAAEARSARDACLIAVRLAELREASR